MVGIILVYYFYHQSFSSLKSKNVVKFCVHISPIFSCPVTFSLANFTQNNFEVDVDLQYYITYMHINNIAN